MAHDSSNTAVAFPHPLLPADPRFVDTDQRRWKVDWARYWCFKSQKREKRIVPAARSEGGASGPAGSWSLPQTGLAIAPPSSPASFINSSAQSPASFTLSLATGSANVSSPGPVNTMFTIGPYAHETQLVSPPVFSTFTTEPSTAPFTPPPELAHLTTPSSPDVPFAQYIASSLQAKARRRDNISPLSTSTLASPCDTPACYTPTSGHPYLGSPMCRLVSPTSEMFSKDVTATNPVTPMGHAASSFPAFGPFAPGTFDEVPFAAIRLSSAANYADDPPTSSVVLLCDSNRVQEDARPHHKDQQMTLRPEKSVSSHQTEDHNIVKGPSDFRNTNDPTRNILDSSDGLYSTSTEDVSLVQKQFEIHAFHSSSWRDNDIALAMKCGQNQIPGRNSYSFNTTNSVENVENVVMEKLG